ncbi:MAG: hypothetical protein IJN25_04030 [Clostridia bacterium]|nr:hypothetical protein [Clostridia bacterium]
MRKIIKKVVGLGCVLVMLGSGAVSARTSYDITIDGSITLLSNTRSTFTGASVDDWPLSKNADKTAIEGASTEIVSNGGAPQPGGGACLKMTSTGNACYVQRDVSEQLETTGEPKSNSKILYGYQNSKTFTGRSTDTLRVSALVKTEELGDGVLPYLEVYYANSVYRKASYGAKSKPFNTQGEWTEIDCMFKIPEVMQDSGAYKARSYYIRLHLPGAGTVYMDHVRIWTDDFNYYNDDQNAASTLTKLTAGTINALYEPIDSAHKVGDTVKMVTCLYETVNGAKRLVSVSPIATTTKVAETPIQLKTTTVVTAEQAKAGASLETFFLNTGIGPVAGCEKISY